MKSFKYVVILALVGILFILGCENQQINTTAPIAQSIEVKKRVGTDHKYEDLIKITALDEVAKVQGILDDIKWQNAEVDMERLADYTFTMHSSSSSPLYQLWVSPHREKVELVIQGESKYAQLDPEPSAILFEALTGTELSDFK